MVRASSHTETVLQAVHSDRSGRIVVSADYGAAAQSGAVEALDRVLPLPADAQLIPLADRAAVGLDRRGLPRSLGRDRWAVAAILPAGYLRTHVPACEPAGDARPLEPLAYAAVAADAQGELVVAAVACGTPGLAPVADPANAISDRLRAEPANRLLRQLARCARDYGCPAARNAFTGGGECALPLGGPANDDAAPMVALRRGHERAPLDPVTFQATAADAAAVATAHFASGGTAVTFGRACEGEPLGALRTLIDAVTLVRAGTPSGEIVVRTSGSSASALARAAAAGVDRAVVRFASADPVTYEQVHRPSGYRWSDVRATLRDAAAHELALTLELQILPGLTDRGRETDALLSLLGELPRGTALRLTDLASDPYALLAQLPPDPSGTGIPGLLERIGTDAAHLRQVA